MLTCFYCVLVSMALTSGYYIQWDMAGFSGQILNIFGTTHPVFIRNFCQNFKLLFLFHDVLFLPQVHTDASFYYTDNIFKSVLFNDAVSCFYKCTWTSPDGKTHNQIDHMLIDRRWHSSILDLRSFRRADCDTDHCLVVAIVRERFT